MVDVDFYDKTPFALEKLLTSSSSSFVLLFSPFLFTCANQGRRRVAATRIRVTVRFGWLVGFLEHCTAQAELMDSSMMQHENEEARQSMGTKRKQPSEEVANDAKSPDQGVRKKPRFIWAPEVHNQFLNAVRELGYTKAVPTKILALMKVEGLTRENVASHLQKFRLYLRKEHREMQKGRALPNESRKNRSSDTSGISGKSRRSCVLPNTRAMQASGQCTCYVLPQPVTALSNQFGVDPTFQGIFRTPSNDMLSENGFQGISGGGLEHGFYDSNCLYDYNGLEINGPLPPNPLVDSYGDSFLPQLDNLSIAYRGVTSPSVNQNMENVGGVVHSPRLLGGGVVHSPRLLGGGVEHFPRHGELDGGLVNSPRPGGLDGGLVNQPRGGGLDGGVMHSPRRGQRRGSLMHSPSGFHGGAVCGMIGPQGAAYSAVEAQRLGGEAMHGPVEVPGLGGGDVYYPVEAPGLGLGAVRCPVMPGGGVQCPVEGPELGGGTMNDAPGLAGGSLNHHPVDEPGLTGGDTYRQANATELLRSDAQENHPIFDAEEEFFSFDDDWMNFIQEDLEDTGIDGLFR
ncbi:hypothetical protein MLD38_005657 [Melastoma candidum]|uniref:Uncharacterized protein n=1 Tax=Melastoma candidum TaxID=119954 RepID=A0ACB9RKC9_9MYRT|nr:hypothetical protein MLD38_005657 [Melastoma candidum]